MGSCNSGADGRTRTDTPFLARAPKTRASTNFATSAYLASSAYASLALDSQRFSLT